ncbi:hypothetical protein LINPERPRIM_LOCUS13893 [Linum perenne]
MLLRSLLSASFVVEIGRS